MSKNKRNNTQELINQLAKGYKEMAEINLEIAQMCLKADNESLSRCEEKLTECE